MPSRKRLQGRLRKVTALRQNASNSLILHDANKCNHGCEEIIDSGDICFRFVRQFEVELSSVSSTNDSGSFADYEATIRILRKNHVYTEIWDNQANQERVQQLFLSLGSTLLLKQERVYRQNREVFYKYNNMAATVAIAILHAQHNFDCVDTHGANSRDLIRDLNLGSHESDTTKFFNRKIPCRCLKARYSRVKSESKLAKCMHCGVKKDRKLLFLCGKCRWSHYCGVECQQVLCEAYLRMNCTLMSFPYSPSYLFSTCSWTTTVTKHFVTSTRNLLLGIIWKNTL